MEKVLNATTPKQRLIEQLRPPDETVDGAASTAPSVLPADHPLLAKFQKALRAHLDKVNNELADEIAALDFANKKLSRENEDVGSNLYDYRQEIERQKDQLDDYNSQLKEAAEKRSHFEKSAAARKRDFDALNRTYQNANRAHNERLMELQHAQVLENNIAKWTQEIEDEVTTAKRMVSKDGQDQLIVSQRKKQMDLILFNLDDEVRRSERQLAAINEQLAEQTNGLAVLNRSIADANSDLNALQHEHKRLCGAWNEVILAIKFRDRNLAQLRDELRTEDQHHKVLQSNIDGTKKSASKEMEQNEKLEAFKLRLATDIETLEANLGKEDEECSRLSQKIDNMTAVVEQTETDLSAANIEGQITENHLKSLRRTLEKQLQEKVKLEEQILELLQDQITTDNASTYRGKILRDTQEKRRAMELNMFGTEQQLSQLMFDLEKWKALVTQDKDNIEKLASENSEQNKQSDKLNSDISLVKNSINIKNKTFDLLNKELNMLIEAAGGHELDPNEVKLVALEKNMAEIISEINEAQNFWLRLQGHVVELSEKRSNQLNSIHLARKQLLVIEQKTLKIDTDLTTLKLQDQETERKLKKLYGQLDTLNAQVYAKKKHHEQEEVECGFVHQVLVDKLKSHEMSMMRIQQEIHARMAEVEETKELAIERHREALSWETKWKMAVDTRRFRQKEFASASEIGTMKSEIHRMEVRLAQLRRAQEKLVQDMDNCVMHRDHIFDGANMRGKMPEAKTRSRFTIQHRLNDMKNKYKQVHNEMAGIERGIGELNDQHGQWLTDVAVLEQAGDEERCQDSMLQNEIEQALLLKQENLENIVRVQHRAKRYRSLLSATQLPKCRSEAKLIADTDRQQEINNHLVSVLDTLLTEYPDQKMNIKRVLQTLRGFEDD